jgi:hypothetical protein
MTIPVITPQAAIVGIIGLMIGLLTGFFFALAAKGGDSHVCRCRHDIHPDEVLAEELSKREENEQKPRNVN